MVFRPAQVWTGSDWDDIGDKRLKNGYAYNSTVYFTSNGTFTKATYPWLRAIRVKCQGGGGGGGGVPTTSAGEVCVAGSGGGGGYAESFITDIAGLDASVTVTVGSGGSGGAAGANGGSTGGTSSFGTAVIAPGGRGSSGAGAVAAPWLSVEVAEGDAPTGDIAVRGAPTYSTPIPAAFFVTLQTSGGSKFASGRARGSSTTGTDGPAGYNGGGGGMGGGNSENQGTARAGGAGGAGIVIVELYA
jgi:hypothetical protein